MALLNPMEYHASTSLLIQMLEKGHHGVKLAEHEPRSAGAALLLDRLECAPRRQLESAAVPELRPAATPLRTGQGVCQQRRRSGRRVRRRRPRRSSKRTPIPFVAPPPEQPVQPDGLKAAGFPLTAAEAQPAATGQPRGSAESHRPGRRRHADLGLDSRRRVRDGQPGRRAGRTAARRGPREPALLDGRHRSDQRPVRLVRSAARHALHRHALVGSRRAGPHRQSPGSAGGPRLLVGSHAILPVAERQDGPGGDAAHRGPMGMGGPRGHRDAVLLRHAGDRLRPLRQSGRPGAPLVQDGLRRSQRPAAAQSLSAGDEFPACTTSVSATRGSWWTMSARPRPTPGG